MDEKKNFHSRSGRVDWPGWVGSVGESENKANHQYISTFYSSMQHFNKYECQAYQSPSPIEFRLNSVVLTWQAIGQSVAALTWPVNSGSLAALTQKINPSCIVTYIG